MRLMAIFAAAAALALAGCGGGSKDNSSGTSTPSSGGAGSTLAVAADPSGALKFTQTSLTAKAGSVTVKFSNQSSVPHAVSIEGNGVNSSTSVVTAGDSSVVVNLKPGKYTFFCPVDGHRAAGMEGTLTVT
jgi:plastocyanin